MMPLIQIERTILIAATVTLASCASNPAQEIPINNAEVAPLSQSEQIQTFQSGAVTSTEVAQIGSANDDYSADQISSDIDTVQLTVEQLKAYADRCAPGQYSSSITDIDCSELSLRVRRVFKTEDKITDALITLGRLGRNDSSKDVEDELGNNSGDLSYSAQAVASGAWDTPPSTLPDQPVVSPELESFLNEIGLGINAGAIVVRPGG